MYTDGCRLKKKTWWPGGYLYIWRFDMLRKNKHSICVGCDGGVCGTFDSPHKKILYCNLYNIVYWLV